MPRKNKGICGADYIFPIDIYYDDLKIGNPLGSHAGIHKLGAIYASIPLLPITVSSQLHNIFVLALFHSKDLKFYGKPHVFKRVIDDLISLQNDGVTITLSGKKINIRFVIGQILGDNLGLNCVLGYSECFSAMHFCRLCKSDKLKCSQETDPRKFCMRTKHNFETDLATNNPKITGIKEASPFLIIRLVPRTSDLQTVKFSTRTRSEKNF